MAQMPAAAAGWWFLVEEVLSRRSAEHKASHGAIIEKYLWEACGRDYPVRTMSKLPLLCGSGSHWVEA
jgi:hypothetical protein